VTYEYFKLALAKRRRQNESGNLKQSNEQWKWSDKLVSAAIAKLIAAGVSYPHEVCFI
jgi:hypothetical protein